MDYFVCAMAWLSTGIGVATAIFVTGSASPLLAILIPATFSKKVLKKYK